MPTQAERLDALEALVAQYNEDNRQLQEALDDATQPLGDHHPPARISEPKVASPEYSTGKRSQVNLFISQVTQVVQLQSSRFPNDSIKVGYAGTFLRDVAFLWYQPFLGKVGVERPAWLDNFALFCVELRKIFGDPDEKATAERNLYNLHQKGAASTYIAEFRRFTGLLNWNNDAQAAQFYRGLKDEVKNELARIGRPEELEDLIEATTRIDNRLYERRLEQGIPVVDSFASAVAKPLPFKPGFNSQSTFQRSSPTPTITRQPARTPQSLPSLPLTRSGHLQPDEYKKRQERGACLYCGDDSHVVKDCPKAKAGNAGVTRTAAASNQLRGVQGNKVHLGKAQAHSNQ
ncbi:hypothetical protein P7C73_g5871, partial [Tremellales sp. Uapishka_1]